MHRLASVLAAAGNVVLSPAIPDLMQLQLHPRALEDFRAAFDTLAVQPEMAGISRIRIFSVSVGSAPALRLAADPDYAERISGLVCLGGYAKPDDLVDALLGRSPAGAGDPLNRPTVFLTALDRFRTPINDRDRLADAWRRYIRSTWPRRELKTPGSTAHYPIANHIAESVHQGDRDFFLMGCGVTPGGEASYDEAFRSDPAAFAHLDPLIAARNIRAEVHLVHGVHDRVIPFSQLEILRKHIPGARAYPMRLFAHSSAVTFGRPAGLLADLCGDAVGFVRIASALANRA